MSPLLIYFIKANAALIVFYITFRLFFRRDTLWKTKRVYLLLTIFISFIYPLISLSSWFSASEPMQIFVAEWSPQLQEITIFPEYQTTLFTWKNIAISLYILLSSCLFFKMIAQILSIYNWKRKSKKHSLYNINVRYTDEDINPFSFFNWIIINPAKHNEAQIKEIITHEYAHCRQLHSIDILLGELLTVILWINPASWLIKREIRQNLEFLADNKVVDSGYNVKNYQYNLLQMTLQSPDIQIANKFNVSPLKKRITMMNQTKTRKAGLLKYLLIIPVTFALIISSNAENMISNAVESGAKEVSVQEDKQGDVLLHPVETMPEYPGGQAGLNKYIIENLIYPPTAVNDGIEGRVVCQFVVEKDGSISDVKVVRSVAPILDNEAVRIIKNMPKWKPATQEGKAVRTNYTLPVSFKLSPKENNTPSTTSNNNIMNEVDKIPEFPGGQNGLMQYIGQNLRYPATAVKNKKQGRVTCQFVVEKDGSITDVEVVRSIDPDLDKEALRVVKAMPKWTPGSHKGETVRVRYTLPINFKLDENDTSLRNDYGEKILIVVDDVVMNENFDVNEISMENVKEFSVFTGESIGNELIEKYGEEARKGVFVITTQNK